MGARINSYRPATIASTPKVPTNKKNGDPEKIRAKNIPEAKKEDYQQKIDTYAAYRKRKYAERIKTRFDLFL